MSRDLSHYFSCETYLIAYASGSRDGFVREHVDNCSFCEALVYGGTDEFPLSFEEEVAQVRAERQRLKKTESRRTFFKISAAAILGLATLGTTGVIASRFLRSSNKAIHETKLNHEKLDQAFSAGGVYAVAAMMDSSDAVRRSMILEWVMVRGHKSMIGTAVAHLIDPAATVRADAAACLASFDFADLKPWKSQVLIAASTLTDSQEKKTLMLIASQIP